MNPKNPTIIGNVYSPESSEILDHLPLLICKFLPDTTLTYINQSCCSTFGKTKQELYATRWIQFLPESVRDKIYEFLKNVKNTLEPESHSYKIRNAIGELLNVEWRIYPVIDAQNQFQGYLAVGADKTKEVNAESNVKEKEDFLKKIFGTIEDAIWSVDKNYTLTYFNEAMKKRHEGLSGIEIRIGMTLEEIIPDPELKNLFKTSLEKAFQNEQFVHDHNIDGRTLELSFNPIIKEDEVTGVAVFCKDVTERMAMAEKLERSEANLRILIENAQDSILSVDRNYRIIVMNHSFHNSIKNGYGIDLKPGMSLVEHFGSEMHHYWKQVYDETFSGSSIQKELELKTENGPSNYYEILTYPILSHFISANRKPQKNESSHISDTVDDEDPFQEETISGATVYIRDITERKLNEQKALDSIKSKDRLLAAVAHDLKNPISGILSLTELMKDQATDQNNIELLNMMLRAGSKSLNIIQELLQIAEMENENYRLKLEKANLNHLIENLIKQNLAEAEKNKIKLYANLGTDPIHVQIELPKFQRVLENLISNSLKFTKEGGEILIRSYAENKNAIIEVEDSGIGIPASFQSVIFEQFTRAKRQGLKGEETTGLGMSIVKVIVELHKGKIRLESQEGIGTKFIIELPLDL